MSPLKYPTFFSFLGRFITINRQRIIQIMYIRAEMKDIRNIHLLKVERKEDRMAAILDN